MNNKDLLNLLDGIQEQNENNDNERILLVDALNLFFRNFAVLNMINPEGNHIGGLGGFFRSLGGLIKHLQPTKVYIIFDGIGGSNNRKNLIPEYKSGRTQRITNWDVFEDQDDENESKVNQIVRIIHYLKILPVRMAVLDKVEADDIIAYYSTSLIKHPNDRIFIVSSDKDYIQLINQNVVVYNPLEKEILTDTSIRHKYKIPSHNFIIYKTLLGDNSDKIRGVKGLGDKKLLKLFPELASDKKITLDDIYDISASKLKDHVIYSRIVQSISELETHYKVMDLSNPMVDEHEKAVLDEMASSKLPNFIPERFKVLYNEDNIGGIIKNVDYWLKETFQELKK
jgi:DNA polymerase-1